MPQVEQGHSPVAPPDDPVPRVVGPVLLWYATLGGAVLWAAHEILAWGVVELACSRGHDSVLGIGLRTFLLLATAIPLAGALVALALSVLAQRRFDAVPEPDRRIARGRFQAEVAFWADALAALIIVLDGAAVLVLAPCAR
jgi:hypothetical protein